MIDIHMCEYMVINEAWVHRDATGMRNYEINGTLLSTTSTPSTGYRVGILNNDGEEKSKKGGNSRKLKYVNSGGESDHKVSGEEGEFVNDGRGDVWDGSPKLKKSCHEVGNGSFSVRTGAMKESTRASGCLEISVNVSAGELTRSERAN